MTNSTHPTLATRLSGAIAIVLMWRQRSTDRAQLRGLESRTLRDIGCTEIDRCRECDKWFWQP